RSGVYYRHKGRKGNRLVIKPQASVLLKFSCLKRNHLVRCFYDLDGSASCSMTLADHRADARPDVDYLIFSHTKVRTLFWRVRGLGDGPIIRLRRLPSNL